MPPPMLFDVVAVGDFQRRLIAVGRRALERNLVEGDGLAGGDGQAIEAPVPTRIFSVRLFNVVAGFADGGFKAAELHDLRFQLGARDRGLHGNRVRSTTPLSSMLTIVQMRSFSPVISSVCPAVSSV